MADANGIKLEADAYFLPDLIRQTYPEARRSQIAILGVLSDHLNRRSQTADRDARAELPVRQEGQWHVVGPGLPKAEDGDPLDRRRPDRARPAKVGIDLKLNKKLAEMIYEIEDGRRPMQWENLDELAAYATELGEPMSIDAP